MKQTYLVDKLRSLDDESFVEVIGSVTERLAHTDIKPNDDIIHISELDAELTAVRLGRDKFRGLSSGFKSLDAKAGGLEPGSVTLVGGITSSGKSALATNIAVKVAATGTAVLYVSLEMTMNQMLDRIDRIVTDVTPLNLMLQKYFALDYKDLRPLLMKARNDGEVELVVLDYLQYLGRGMTNDEVAKMSKTIKALALEFNIAFMVIVSIRKGEGGKYKRKWTDLEIEDFMGTSALGYDCDTAYVVSRRNEADEYDKEHLFIKMLKTRNHKMDWEERYLTFDWNNLLITDCHDWIGT